MKPEDLKRLKQADEDLQYIMSVNADYVTGRMNGLTDNETERRANAAYDTIISKVDILIDAEIARQSVTDDARVENKQMIYANIRAERARQDAKWGFPQHNSLSEWGNILGEEYGEYLKALNELVFGRTKDPGEMTDELIHVAAVAVGILEHLLMDGGIRE